MNRQLRRHPVGGAQPGQASKGPTRLPKLAPHGPRPHRGVKGLLKPYWAQDILSELRRLNRWRKARIDVVAVGSDTIAARWRDVLLRLTQETGGTLVKR